MSSQLHSDVIKADDVIVVSVECPDHLITNIEERFDDAEVIDSWFRRGEEDRHLDDFGIEGPSDEWTLMHSVDLYIDQ